MPRGTRNKLVTDLKAPISGPTDIDDSESDDNLHDGQEASENIITAVSQANIQATSGATATYCPVSKQNSFHKVRKRAQCGVCGEFGHQKSRCPMNMNKSNERRPRGSAPSRERLASVMPTILSISSGPTPDDIDESAEEGQGSQEKAPELGDYDSNDEPVINKSWAEVHYRDDAWEMRYQELLKYSEEHGHCNVPHTYRVKLPDGTFATLGQWLQDQRKEKRQGNMKPSRLEKLQALVDEGLLEWKPLRAEERKWLIRFQAVVNCATERNSLEFPNEDVLLEDGSKVDLGRWLSRELNLLRSNKLSLERDRLIHDHLVVPGYLSADEYDNRITDRKISGESQWLAKYEALLSYGLTNGDYNVPKDFSFMDEGDKVVMLGAWLVSQRKEYKNRTLPPHREEKLNALMEHGFKWDASFKSDQWEKRFEALLRFYDEFKTCNVPHSYKYVDADGTEVALGRWLENQRRCKKLKTLPPDRDRKLQALVDRRIMYWDIYEADRKFRSWQENFNLLVAYGETTGTCDVPDNTIITTVDKTGNTKKVYLGHWLTQQKIAKLENKLDVDRYNQLERLVADGKMTWEVSEGVLHARANQEAAASQAIALESAASTGAQADEVASDSEDEGVSMQMHSVTQSASHRGLGYVAPKAAKKRQAKAKDESEELAEEAEPEPEDDEQVVFEKKSTKKRRTKK